MNNEELEKLKAKSMKDELKDLGLKIEGLQEFMYTDTFANLPAIELGLQMVQIRGMKMYYEALKDRIIE